MDARRLVEHEHLLFEDELESPDTNVASRNIPVVVVVDKTQKCYSLLVDIVDAPEVPQV